MNQLIFYRTPEGNAAALNPRSSLPRLAKRVLFALDGRPANTLLFGGSCSQEDVNLMLELLMELRLMHAVSAPDEAGLHRSAV